MADAAISSGMKLSITLVCIGVTAFCKWFQKGGNQNAQDAGTTGQKMGASNFSNSAAPPQQIGASNFSDLAAPPQILNIPHLHNDQNTYGGISSNLQTSMGVQTRSDQETMAAAANSNVIKGIIVLLAFLYNLCFQRRTIKAEYNKVSSINNENNESESTTSPVPASDASNNGKENKRLDEDKSESSSRSGGKGNGDDSDEDEESDESSENNDESVGGTDGDDWNKLFKELVTNATENKKYKGKYYHKIKENGKDIWISRDKAGHAGSRFKVYSDKKSYIEFDGSRDARFKPIHGKHESRAGTKIRKSEMDGIPMRKKPNSIL